MIGSTFGAVDELIPACDYVRDRAHCLTDTFRVPAHGIEMLLNAPIITFNTESILMRAGDPSRCHLVLTGRWS